MPHRTERQHKITLTKPRKRPNVRLCGGGLNRPDRGQKRSPRQGADSAKSGCRFILRLFLILNWIYRRLHGYICIVRSKLEFNRKDAMKNLILYLAYGSNMLPDTGASFVPGATALGVARLPDYRLAERLYADIDFSEGESVFGVLYLITERDMRSLDAYEGYPKVYRREWLEVEYRGESYTALTYEMSAATKIARDGQPYPDDYRKICSAGARFYHVPNKFTKRKSSK